MAILLWRLLLVHFCCEFLPPLRGRMVWQAVVRLAAYGIVLRPKGWETAAVSLTLGAFQVLLDRSEHWFSERRDWRLFVAAQSIHIMAIVVVAAFVVGQGSSILGVSTDTLRSIPVLQVLCGYVTVVFGGGILVQQVCEFFFKRLEQDVAQQKPGIPEAGKYIGWVERFLILTFVLAGYGDAIGWLLGAKALVRYPEIKEDVRGHFADYFLIGTITSVGVSLGGGLLLKYLLG